MDWYFNIIKKDQLFPNCSIDSIQWQSIFKKAFYVCVQTVQLIYMKV